MVWLASLVKLSLLALDLFGDLILCLVFRDTTLLMLPHSKNHRKCFFTSHCWFSGWWVVLMLLSLCIEHFAKLLVMGELFSAVRWGCVCISFFLIIFSLLVYCAASGVTVNYYEMLLFVFRVLKKRLRGIQKKEQSLQGVFFILLDSKNLIRALLFLFLRNAYLLSLYLQTIECATCFSWTCEMKNNWRPRR